ncbi:hypothetical protein I317_03860 [Kwoniella heveanensis CBS 569]|nr:hypothetical protein I317_03860 [Kwoniella heveanensis CBS 569]
MPSFTPKPKLHIPISEKTSPFFSSPYDPNAHHSSSSSQQLSPLPSTSDISSKGEGEIDSQTPLLPPSPAMLEKGRGSYPFPSSHTSRLKRMRMAWRNGLPGGMVKRVAVLTLVLALAVLTLHQGSTRFIAPRVSTSGSDFASSAAAARLPKVSGRPFKFPSFLPSSDVTGARTGTQPPGGGSKGLREIDISSDSLPVEATLRERLDVWKNAPGGRGEIKGEIEHGGFVQWSLEQCDTISEQHNTHMIQHSANVWASVNRTSLHQYRMDLIDHMEHVLAEGLTEQYGEGRGIVMVAGNADTLTRVKWSLQMLRSYGSTLPVQIYHFPSERPADDSPLRTELQDLGAELVEAAGQEKDKGKTKSYHLKAIAVVQSPFREVLYLDSDSIPTRDPEYMFDAPNYKRLGIFATPDYWKTSANNPIWAIMGVKCRNEWEMETGQMFVDKKMHLDVFLLIQYMLERHDFWFYFSDGDKDIFRWALLALRKRWAVPGRWVGAAALPSGTASGDFCAHTMLQHDSWGEPLFVHYNLLKQIPSGVGRGYSWGRTKQMPLFNTWPATPATARLGEPEYKPSDDDKPGLGDTDCDMLADADEHGRARAEAKEMIMRRAARERGIKVRYHGGWISALCIDLDYIDPRPEERKEEDAARKALLEEQAALAASALSSDSGSSSTSDDESQPKDAAQADEAEGQKDSNGDHVGTIYPDWGSNPIEVVQWRDDENLKDFEKNIYDLGFKPGGPGF